MLVINRKKANLYRLGLIGGSRIIFWPGVNTFTDEEVIKALQENKTYLELIKNGVHEIVKTVSENGIASPTDISAMSMSDAKEIIAKVLSIQGLESMYHQEDGQKSRKGVLTAIEDQIKSIKEEDTKK